MAISWYGALDRVSARCREDPFLYTTVKLYCCRKSIIFCRHLGAEARSVMSVHVCDNEIWSLVAAVDLRGDCNGICGRRSGHAAECF